VAVQNERFYSSEGEKLTMDPDLKSWNRFFEYIIKAKGRIDCLSKPKMALV